MWREFLIGCCVLWLSGAGGPGLVFAQALGQPDRSQPGDQMIQEYLARETERITAGFATDLAHEEGVATRPVADREQFLDMLGLWPLPEKTPLQATVTGTLAQPGYIVEKLHYQSRPGLYVTGNLYRPATVTSGEKLPAVLYVCGHAGMQRNGNKTAYQSHGIWLAKHGYVCLVVDTLQLGEISAIHHGTYREQRWWWHSRGYTSAGVECWNGVRGIDYLVSRADVDPEKIGVTGASGGGAATFWIAGADERVKVAIPISGMSDLPAYVTNRVANGHCDCMFFYNTYQWPWVRIATVYGPKPLLFINSDADPIFPMDGNERISAQLERFYSLHGASELFETVVSVGGHAYRKDIRQATFRFLNMHLKNDARVVLDSEEDIEQTTPGQPTTYPIDPEQLRVFPTDADLPRDELNTTIDQHFVPVAQVKLPTVGSYETWRQELLTRLMAQSFRAFPLQIPAARRLPERPGSTTLLETELGIHVTLSRHGEAPQERPKRVLLVLRGESRDLDWLQAAQKAGDDVQLLEPRGIGPTAWTRKNPPNYVERAHVLLGRTVDGGRVQDLIATVKFLQHQHGSDMPIVVAGQGPEALLAAYAAALEVSINGVIAHEPPASHMAGHAPALLNVLRVCDAPHVLGMIAPRRLRLTTSDADLRATVETIYQAAEGEPQLTLVETPLPEKSQ